MNNQMATDKVTNIHFDNGTLEWTDTIDKKQKAYIMKLETMALAYTFWLFYNYAPQSQISLDMSYEDVHGIDFNYTNEEKQTIKNNAIKLLKTKYNITMLKEYR